MPDPDTRHNADLRAAKHAAVLGAQKKNRLPLIACLALLAAAPVGAYWVLDRPQSPPAAPAALREAAASGLLTHPVALFDDGQARHFQHTDGGITVRYFVIKSSDGVLRAAFDACDVCWPAGKGYVQEGDSMVCRNCGRRFASVRINEVKGGCNPAPLARRIEGDRLVLRVTDILEGKPYFDFKGRS